MNLEMIVSIAAALVIAACLALRLNILKASKLSLSGFQLLEVVGGATGLAGCVCIIGEWFLPSLDKVHGETILLVGIACFAVGVSNGRLCQFAARLQGWDGKTDRRERGASQEETSALDRRFTRVQ